MREDPDYGCRWEKRGAGGSIAELNGQGSSRACPSFIFSETDILRTPTCYPYSSVCHPDLLISDSTLPLSRPNRPTSPSAPRLLLSRPGPLSFLPRSFSHPSSTTPEIPSHKHQAILPPPLHFRSTDTMGLPAPQGSPPQSSPKMPAATPVVNGTPNGVAPNPNNPNENIKRFEAPSRSLSPLRHALFHSKTRCFV